MERADFTARQRETFGVALRVARGDTATAKVADELGYRSGGTVGHWEAATSPPPEAPVVFALEQMFELAPGELSQHLGYLPVDVGHPECTVETAILTDPSLDEDDRKIIRATYRRLSR